MSREMRTCHVLPHFSPEKSVWQHELYGGANSAQCRCLLVRSGLSGEHGSRGFQEAAPWGPSWETDAVLHRGAAATLSTWLWPWGVGPLLGAWPARLALPSLVSLRLLDSPERTTASLVAGWGHRTADPSPHAQPGPPLVAHLSLLPAQQSGVSPLPGKQQW